MKCAHCKEKAVTTDALGLDVCLKHRGEADEYVFNATRSPLQQRIIAIGVKAGVEPVIFEASDHPYSCTCEKCREWWRLMGPDPDNPDSPYGPFGNSVEATE